MRCVICTFVALANACGGLRATAAEAPSSFVIPGKAGVPVIINGVDASYTVVEGDWGLSRPGHVAPTIVTPPLLGVPQGTYGSYFPARGIQPGYGRHEIEPPANRQLPRPAPRFHRQWSTQSDPTPATHDPPIVMPFSIEAQFGPRPRPARRRVN